MGNIIGEPFHDYVDNQIKKRQEIHGKELRTNEEIVSLNSNLSWVKLASSVDLEQERVNLLRKNYKNIIADNIKSGKDLAQKYVLFNGINKSNPGNNQRSGYNSTNGTYSNDKTLGGTEFGIVPMPGIISMDSQDLNNGSIRKTRVKVKAYNRQQFDVLDVLYLRLGYTVLLEFGNSHYWNSGDNGSIKPQKHLQKMGATLIDTVFFSDTSPTPYQLLEEIESQRRSKSGNYDGILGKVVNFTWSFLDDGTYDIDIDIISLGDVIESLKINLPPVRDYEHSLSQEANRQAVLAQFSQRAANNQEDFYRLYDGLSDGLDKWYEKTLNPNPKDSPNVAFTLSALPNSFQMFSSLRDLWGSYSKTQLQNEGIYFITNEPYNPGSSAGNIAGDQARDIWNGSGRVRNKRGTLSVFNLPSQFNANKKEVAELEKYFQQDYEETNDQVRIKQRENVKTLLSSAVQYAICMKIQGFYGGPEFQNPFLLPAFVWQTKDSTKTVTDYLNKLEKDTPGQIKTDNNKYWKNLNDVQKEQINLWDSNFGGALNKQSFYTDGKTSNSLIGNNEFPSAIDAIVGEAQVHGIREKTGNVFIRKEIVTTATFRPSKPELGWNKKINPSYSEYSTQVGRSANFTDQAYAGSSGYSDLGSEKQSPYGNVTVKGKTMNFNNTKVEVKQDINLTYDPWCRAAALHALFFRPSYVPFKTQGAYPVGSGEKNKLYNFAKYWGMWGPGYYVKSPEEKKHSASMLFRNFPKDEFKFLIFRFFRLMNAAGGPDDNATAEDPTYASFNQELNIEKNQNRLNAHFYGVRNYTGTTFGHISINNTPKLPDLDSSIKIGTVLNPMDAASKKLTPNEIFNTLLVQDIDQIVLAGDFLYKKRHNIQSSGYNNIIMRTWVRVIEKTERARTYFLEDPDFWIQRLAKINTGDPKSVLDKASDSIVGAWNDQVGWPKYTGNSGQIDYVKFNGFKKPVGDGEMILSGDKSKRWNYFIRLGTLLKFIEQNIIPQIIPSTKSEKKVPLLKIDTNPTTNICYVIDNVFSTDFKTCVVRNDNFQAYRGTSFTANKLFDGQPGLDYFLNNVKGSHYGRIMNIYMNFEFCQNLMDELKDKKDETTLFKYLEGLCGGINRALGNVNNLQPVVDSSKNTIKIIDQTPIPNIKEIASTLPGYKKYIPSSPAVLEVYGFDGKQEKSSFVHSIGLQTSISKEYAAMISIGATANGSVPGMEATAFSRWNIGVTDRIKPVLVDGSMENSDASITAQNQLVIDRYMQLISLDSEGDKYKLLGLSPDTIFNEEYLKQNPQIVSDWYKYAQAQSSKSGGELESSIGFLPFNLKITMEGLSGIKIFQRVNINTKFLPSNYPRTLSFIVTKINHKVQDNKWVTSLETLATKIIDDKKPAGKVINTPDLLNAVDTFPVGGYSQAQRDAAVMPPDEYNATKPDGSNGKLSPSQLKPLTAIGFPAEKLAVEAADKFMEMWQAMVAANITLPNDMSSYRKYAMQYKIFDIDLFIKSGGSKTNIYGKKPKVKRFKKGSNGKTPVAYPGKSNHGWGTAVDIGGRSSKYEAMRCFIKKNGKKYGWGWKEGKSIGEPWHFTYYGFNSAGKSKVDDSGYINDCK